MSYLLVGCQAVVTVVFAAASVSKLRCRAEFRRTLMSALKMPLPRTGVMGWAVVVAEATTALAVVAVPAVGFVLGAVLLAGFTAVIVSMMRRRVRTPCRCFGAGERPPGAVHLVRNAVLFATAAAGGGFAVTGAGPRADLPAAVVAAAVGVIVAVLLIYLEDILALAQPVRASAR